MTASSKRNDAPHQHDDIEDEIVDLLEQSVDTGRRNPLITLPGRIGAGLTVLAIVLGMPVNTYLASDIGATLGAKIEDNTTALKALGEEVRENRHWFELTMQREIDRMEQRLALLEERQNVLREAVKEK